MENEALVNYEKDWCKAHDKKYKPIRIELSSETLTNIKVEKKLEEDSEQITSCGYKEEE